MKNILVVPSAEKGRGGGHLVRSVQLVLSLREMETAAFLFLSAEGRRGEIFEQIAANTGNSAINDAWLIGDFSGAKKIRWDFIVLDRFQTPKDEAETWLSLAPVIAVDEGGPYRPYFDFLLDQLPGLPDKTPPNETRPDLLPLPKKMPQKTPGAILISFGAEDAAGLGPAVLRALVPLAENSVELTLVTSSAPASLFSLLSENSPCIKILPLIPNLRDKLAGFDLLITHFGLTAFEALAVHVPVLLVSPGKYHEKLAKNAGFFSTGIGSQGARTAGKILCDGGKKKLNIAAIRTITERSEQVAARYGLDGTAVGSKAAVYFKDITMQSPHYCPACGASGLHSPAIARFPDRSYRRCPECGLIYLQRDNPPPIEYETDYFFGFYRKQYGKTYLEDFPNLVRAGKQRLGRIRALLKPVSGLHLLDIGCAYGPFLAAAREEGFLPEGLEVAEDAVRYVNEELGLSARRGFFPEITRGETNGTYDVITLWYVIEHIENLKDAFAEIRRLLKPGGVLAFSTPSFSGISGRFSLYRFLEKSPADHRTVMAPAQIKKTLNKNGFVLKKIAPSGHHPERFPLCASLAGRKKNLLYRFLLFISERFRLGDTFEVYAVNRDALSK
ncbi:hypothetical protein FACS1894151_00260 [Spirochaetia bacterium]|nr:hypothetical protein FACS1894151_00260 [Spirochaetia bacterium]